MAFDRFDQLSADTHSLKSRVNGDIDLTYMTVALHAAWTAKADIAAQLAILQSDQL
ncbi:hypothetical protein D3C81_1762680 [compost metagenome]